jgi:hypothetical protein
MGMIPLADFTSLFQYITTASFHCTTVNKEERRLLECYAVWLL